MGLLNSVSAESIEKRSTPPQLSFKTPVTLPKVPADITIVKLKRQDINPLLSQTYSMQVFQRVELYFRRFFATDDPSLKITVDEVHVILNSEVQNRFKAKEAQLHATRAGQQAFGDETQNNLQLNYLHQLYTSENLVKERNSNPIAAWHGANKAKIDGIMWYGLLNLSTTDPGYFGKGIYMTQLPKYGQYYIKLKDTDEGQFEMLLCWTLLGNPFAQTKVAMGKPAEKGYDSHYVLVKKKAADTSFCASDSDYKAISKFEQFYPIDESDFGQEQGDEICVFDSAQVLPRYIVKYSVSKNKTQSNPSLNASFKELPKVPSMKELPKVSSMKDLPTIPQKLSATPPTPSETVNSAPKTLPPIPTPTKLLLEAVQQNDLACVKQHIQQKTNQLNNKDSEGKTALHHACTYGYTDIARELANAGADINAPDTKGFCPFFLACENGHLVC